MKKFITFIFVFFAMFSFSVFAVSDIDGDGVDDSADNCVMVANANQRDTDLDGFGNRCDADLNQDGIVNAADLYLFKEVFGTNDENSDFDGDGIVNSDDLDILQSLFLLPPGPSCCAG